MGYRSVQGSSVVIDEREAGLAVKLLFSDERTETWILPEPAAAALGKGLAQALQKVPAPAKAAPGPKVSRQELRREGGAKVIDRVVRVSTAAGRVNVEMKTRLGIFVGFDLGPEAAALLAEQVTFGLAELGPKAS